MAVLKDYRCGACNAVSEHLVNEEEVATLPCPECGEPRLVALIGATHIGYIKMATDGVRSSDALQTSIDKWQKMREQKMRIEKRNIERHGTPD